MNKGAKILSCITFVFVFFCMAIGYAAVQDTLLVNGTVSVEAQKSVFAVYGEIVDINENSLGKALNFYNREKVEVNGTITLLNDDGTMTYGIQRVEAIYENIDTAAYTSQAEVPWSVHNTSADTAIKTMSVVDEGIQPTNMAYWFSGFNSCTSFNLEKLDTSKVTDMVYMFYGCSAVKTLDLTGFDTSKVTDMVYMFYGCSAVQTLDLTGFDTSKVKGDGGFTSCGMEHMFQGCAALERLDISSFNTNLVEDIQDMFSGCGQLETIYVGEEWNVEHLIPLMGDGKIFNGCTSLVGGNKTPYNAGNKDIEYARIDLPGQAGYFTCKHTYDETDICTICGAEKIIVVTTPDQLTEAIDSGKDYIVNGGTYDKDNGISANGVKVTANNAILTITNANAVSVSNGGTLTLNNVTETSNPSRTALANVQGGTLIINSGTYAAASIAMDYSQNSKSTVIIYGGYFTISGFNGMSGIGFFGVNTMTIYGGTFNIKPTSPYLAPGYVAQDNGDGTWTVVAAE